jgi:hypothetical protein
MTIINTTATAKNKYVLAPCIIYLSRAGIDCIPEWCLAEWYVKGPNGEPGWQICSGWIAASPADARRLILESEGFDSLVFCYEAGPNPGEIKGYGMRYIV